MDIVEQVLFLYFEEKLKQIEIEDYIWIIYIGIISKTEQKTTENAVKEEEKFLPSEVVIKEGK